MKNTFIKRTGEKGPSAPTSSKGFTLLEVLISIALLMVIIALAGTAMRMSIHTVSAGEKKIDALERFRSSLYIVSSQIGSQIPLSDQNGAAGKMIFQGTQKSLRLPTGYSIWSGARGYVIVDYQVMEGDQGKKYLKATEIGMGPSKMGETKLFDNLDDLSFEYFSKKKGIKGEGEWMDVWDDDKMMPEQMKLNFKYDGRKYAFILPLRAQFPIK